MRLAVLRTANIERRTGNGEVNDYFEDETRLMRDAQTPTGVPHRLWFLE